MPIPYEFVRYSLGRGGMPGRTFVLNLESIFILLLCTHINKKNGVLGGGWWGSFVLQIYLLLSIGNDARIW